MKQSIREEEILRIIKERKTISRLELAEIFDLTPARISKIIKSLLDKDIILEKNIGVSTGGRPPVILTINEKIFGEVLGLNLAPKNIFLTVGQINGEISKRKKYSLEKIQDEDILSFIEKLIATTLAAEKKIGVITIIITGFVNREKGISIMSPHYKWRNLNIVKHLEEKFHIPVLLEHDVRAMALTEQQIGACKGVDDFVIFNICEGIGTCTCIDGNIYRGFNSMAGEMGHIVINTSSIRKCSCGKRGCLEAESSNTAIINRITSDIKIGKYSMLKDILSKKGSLDMDDILLGVKKRDFLAIQVTNEAVEYIAQGLNILVSIIDPEKIVLVGNIFTSKFLMDTLKFELNKFSLEFQKCIIEPTKLGDELFYYAPIAVVTKNIFENKEFTKKYITRLGGSYDFN
ncbi:ROK family transcriptional regulator [Fusobacterium perfoetens]|uniref:ROK family transcriptional regulator n=1 Tax=Fusobacterium perfoetens TaxID=852 RepID=UPI001F39D7B8|nr:ROK family transcriptional regulator [Fusobacterium perfoetens]MCF2626378.1 ROK family transcriptional regulator [Fusobacterium perfoetens]